MTRRPSRDAIADWGWFGVCLIALSWLRLQKFAGAGPYGLDASFYYQIARHVARGDGLLTSVSLYFEGWQLPARTIAYPLWPLVLGAFGRLFGMVRAANLLPPALYLTSLPLIFLQARAIDAELSGRRAWPWWCPGVPHLLMLLFGLNVVYFSSTTHPYTEGLAFNLAIGALLLLRRRSVGAAAASGLLASLAFLARSQMIAVGVGSFAVLAFAAWRKRSAAGARLAAFTAVAAAPVVAWMSYVGYVPGVAVLGNAASRVALPGFAQQVASSGALDYILKRLPGLAVAFDPVGAGSYVRIFGSAAYLVPLALILWAFVPRYRVSIDSESTVATLIAGLFSFATLFLYRGDFFLPWLFGWRHGIPLIFLLIVIAPWLLRVSERLVSIGVILILCASVLSGLVAVRRFVASDDGALRYSRSEVQLLTWLASKPKVPTVITTRAQTLSYGTDANIHWTICSAEPAMTKLMLQKLPVDYVLVYANETQCAFAQDLGDVMRGDVKFGTGADAIYVLARRSPSRN